MNGRTTLLLALLTGCGSSYSLVDSDALAPGDADGDGVIAAEDCDDDNPDVFPGATETCNGIDDDCDQLVDDDDDSLDTSTRSTFYADGDADGFGDADTTTTACELPSGYVEDAGDCDDSDGDINPDATEVCNGYDDDCDELVDLADDSLDTSTSTWWYADSDGDGFGDPTESVESCEPPGTDYVLDDSDCNDDDETINPDGTEVCDGADDEDCDDTIDEDGADDALTFYADDDDDGYGDPDNTTNSCEQPSGYVENAGDCDDSSGDINPEGTEVCDGVDDEDCDETVDEGGASDASVWYADADEDEYGDPDTTTTACDEPSGYTDNSDDCDDDNADINPDATEICDGEDNDCDELFDDEDDDVDTGTLGLYYEDADEDGYGDASSSIEACSVPSGYVNNADDCDDSDGDISPDADELCSSSDDEDCDGLFEESGAVDATTWYADGDSDGFGDPDSTTASCTQPSGYEDDDDDCDDSQSDVNPAADEYCDGVDDEDCDGTVDENGAVDASSFYLDADGDGYGSLDTTFDACEVPTGYADNDDDCDDLDSAISPSATEVCDGEDNDCDELTDDEDDDVDTGTFTTWYADSDSDGYGDPSSTTGACDVPSGYTSDDNDCDDSDADISPADDEVCDGVNDDDCDGTVDEDGAIDASTWYADVDGDGYGADDDTTTACSQPSGYLSVDGDCDDSDTGINPDADEVCDSGLTDEDCDGNFDEFGATGGTTGWPDVDGDGYGDESADSVLVCELASGYATNQNDCVDSDATIYLGADEICDGVDNDCDGNTDEDSYSNADGDGTDDCKDSSVFSDNFDDAAGASDWATADFSGTSDWGYDDSNYKNNELLEVSEAAETVFYLDTYVEDVWDYTLDVDLDWDASSGDNAGGGILFGWDGSTSGDYWLALWDDPQGAYGSYLAGLSGRVRLMECTGTTCTERDGTNTALSSSKGDFTVSVASGVITVKLGGVAMASYDAGAEVEAGYVGLYADNTYKIEFNNFTFVNDNPF